jgi:(4-(4-[2-(gamma-L-glutamylamino)ethyl]phenoxymethyl)furan-2-yl)methanamine synthase
VLGYDIGGANTKAVFISTQKGLLQDSRVDMEYFPVWKEPEKLTDALSALKKRLKVSGLDGVGVTMTAELSDAYATKREGVLSILSKVKGAFTDVPIYVLNTHVKLEPISHAESKPLDYAAANWAATGWLVAQQVKDCVVVDVGSTSASIIPIVNGRVVAKGKTDLDKLICGELVYTGSLRTNVAAIVHSVLVRNEVAGVASELFALSADVHLALGNINESQYTCETADGRGKKMPEALARLARVVCADTEMLTKQEIMNMAKYIHDQQIMQIAEGLKKVHSFTKKLTHNSIPIVITGMGKDFLARKAAEKISVNSIVDLTTLIQNNAAICTPAFGVALMTASKLEGEPVRWIQQ